MEETKVVELFPNGLTKVELPLQSDENKQAWRNLYARFERSRAKRKSVLITYSKDGHD